MTHRQETTWTCSRSTRPSTFAARRPLRDSMRSPTPWPGTTPSSSSAHGRRITVRVPDEVDLKIEVEIGDDENELEIELTW